MPARALLAAALSSLVTVVPATAAPPSDLSTDPLDRAALLALPSIYRVDVTIHVDGLRLRDGRRVPLLSAARTIPEVGTAVAVAPGGWLITAGHVAAPDAPTVARLAYQSNLAYRGSAAHIDETAADQWVTRTGARAVGARVVSVKVTQADAGGGMDAAASFPVIGVTRSRAADLALIQIDAPNAPALALDEAASKGTPVETIGFGVGSSLDEPARGDLEPAVRRGRIIRTGVLTHARPERPAIAISVPVERGDSGAPVIDSNANVRGIVTLRNAPGGVAEQATEVRQLLTSADVTPGRGEAGDLFRGAMDEFWALDFAQAEQGLDATVRSFPQHTLAPAERARAAALADGRFSLTGRRRRDLLLAVGILAAAAGLACAAGLAFPVLRRGGRGTTGR